jgi:hypothetical protein
MSLTASPALSQTTDVYPKPVNEYTEQTAPGKMSFLSYPKYYTNHENQLVETDTTLVASADPDWDYEVYTGIWSLKIRSDGTFQAQHAGDIFTYRLNSLGVGRGARLQKFDVGEPVWDHFTVSGDTMRWYNVFDGVDLMVRYIHDILKVDVVIRKERMKQIKDAVNNGELDPDDYLTARFDIPSVFITSQAKKGNRDIDLFEEELDISQDPIFFEKNGSMVHKLRLVETYLLDEKGQRMDYLNHDDKPENKINIQSAQHWKLNKEKEGEADMSANLGDLANLPEGDVVIDPSLLYTEFHAPNIATMDAELAYNSSSNLGANTSIDLSPNDRALIACDMASLGYNKAVTHIELNVNMYYNSMGEIELRAYNGDTAWSEANVDWYESNAYVNWGTAGGDYSEENAGTIATHESTGRVCIDLTRPFNARYSAFVDEMSPKGYLVKIESYETSGVMKFYSKEHTTVSERWKIEVDYYEDARTQSVWHRPFLKRRDGDINDPDDRWFPIGWFTTIGYDHYVQGAQGYKDSYIDEFADGYDSNNNGQNNFADMYIYNTFMPKSWVDQRNKRLDDYVWGCGIAADGFPEKFTEIDDFEDMLDVMNTVYGTSYSDSQTRDYYMIPSAVQALDRLDWGGMTEFSYSRDAFSGISSAAKYNIAENDACTTTQEFPFYWSDEDDSLGDLVDGIKSYPSSNPRVMGWGIYEEFYSSVSGTTQRSYMVDRVSSYVDTIIDHDDSSPEKYPVYNVETFLQFYGGYSFSSVQGELIDPADDKIPDLACFDYIFEDFSYYHDFEANVQNQDWEDAVYQAECAMRYTNVGYCRCITARTLDDGDSSNNGDPGDREVWPWESDVELYRYLPYASWAVGGQGLMIWEITHGHAQIWAEHWHQMAREAYAMKDYLMNEPALDIPAIIYDSAASTNHSLRTRFILKKNQDTPTSNEYLLLFCNFANDGQSHSTYVHFPNHTITNVRQIISGQNWGYQLTDNNKTLLYNPSNDSLHITNSKDIYARAYFVTLN